MLYDDLPDKQKELVDMIVDDLKKCVEKTYNRIKNKNLDTYIVEIKLEEPLL